MAKKNPQHPTAAWVFSRPSRVIAFGLGSGLLHPAPGTWGTLVGWALWAALLSRVPDPWVAVILVASFVLGCWACQRCGLALGEPDHGGMVWDEIVAFWLVLWLTPGGLWMQALSFVLFRIFDIFKPPPIRTFDRRLKNGFGVMLDDVLAAVYTLLVMAVIVRMGGG
ncbi:phosphatidylglycerophosphatase A [Castellaniella sp. GW247-6E4]|uniref:phosphatidylglycerophosphatase A family protein n=1 Tax=Castellaniella sp. GW247-6E4 TaxID=3140380 RepID=UPI003316495A